MPVVRVRKILNPALRTLKPLILAAILLAISFNCFCQPSSCPLTASELKKLEKRSTNEIKTIADFHTESDSLKSVEVRGTIRDRRSGEPIPALINIIGTGLSFTADASGAFVMNIPKGPFSIEVIYPGFNKFTSETFIPKGKTKIDVCLGTTVIK